MKRKVFAIAAAACSLTLMLSACGSSNNNAASSSAKAGNEIITAYGGEPQNPLIPGNTNENLGGRVVDLLFSRLVYFDDEGNAHNEVAKSITPNSNATQYTIKLRDDAKFSDGSPVTAESFTKAWSYVANAKNAQKGSSFLSTIKGYKDLQKTDGLTGNEQLSGLKIVDKHTFTVDLNQPDATFPIKIGYTAFAPLPTSFYKDPKAFGEKPVGNGPYMLKKWNHDIDIQLVKNPNYRGSIKLKNGGITFKEYTSIDSAYRDVQAGNLDIMDGIPASATKTFEKDSHINPYNKPGSVFQGIIIPSNLEHFKDGTEEGVLRRQALSVAIDRKALVQKVLNGVGSPAKDFTSPLTPGFDAHLKGSDVLKYNKEKAKALWQKADKISKFTGQLTFSYNADGGAKPIFDAVVNSIKNTLGINAVTTPVPTFQEFRNDITNRQIHGAFRGGWMPDYPSPENYLFQLYASAAADGNGSNDGDYKNPAFDKLLNQAYAAQSTEAANKLYSQAQEILLKDLPAIPLYNSNFTGASAKNVKGFIINWQSLPDYPALTK